MTARFAFKTSRRIWTSCGGRTPIIRTKLMLWWRCIRLKLINCRAHHFTMKSKCPPTPPVMRTIYKIRQIIFPRRTSSCLIRITCASSVSKYYLSLLNAWESIHLYFSFIFFAFSTNGKCPVFIVSLRIYVMNYISGDLMTTAQTRWTYHRTPTMTAESRQTWVVLMRSISSFVIYRSLSKISNLWYSFLNDWSLTSISFFLINFLFIKIICLFYSNA